MILILVQVCQRHLYGDVNEIVPRAAEEIQTELCSIYQRVTETELVAPVISYDCPINPAVIPIEYPHPSLEAGVDALVRRKVKATQSESPTTVKSLLSHPGIFSNPTASFSNVAAGGASDRQEGKGKQSTRTSASASGFNALRTAQEQQPRNTEALEMTQMEEKEDHRPIDPCLGIDLVRRYIYSCFRCSRYGVKAVPLEINGIKFDADLFITLRKLYFAERSYFRRFFELREVKRIQYVQVSRSNHEPKCAYALIKPM